MGCLVRCSHTFGHILSLSILLGMPAHLCIYVISQLCGRITKNRLKKCDLCEIDPGVDVGIRWAGLSIS